MADSLFFHPSEGLDSFIHGIQVGNFSTPSFVEHGTNLYIFWIPEDSPTILYTKTDRSVKTFQPIKNVKDTATHLRTALGSAPCAVPFDGKIYLFYNDADNLNGTMYTVCDGQNDTWSQPKSILHQVGDIPSYREHTSPAAAVYEGKLYVVWIGDGLLRSLPCTAMTLHPDGTTTWKKIDMGDMGIGVPLETSATLVTYKDTMYLFYTGEKNDGTYFVRYRSGTWIPAESVTQHSGNQNIRGSTSPAAGVWNDRLCVLWCATGDDAYRFALTDGTKWCPSQPALLGRSCDVIQGATCAFIDHCHQPWLLAAGLPARQMWMKHARSYSIEPSPWSCQAIFEDLTRDIIHGNYFSIYSYDETTYNIVQKKFGAYWEMTCPPKLGKLLDITGDNGDMVVGPWPALTFNAMLSAAIHRPDYYHISVTTDANTHSFVVSFGINLK